MLCFSGEGTVLNYEVTGSKEYDAQEKFKLEILSFWRRYGLLTDSKVNLHQKPFYIMMKATITASGVSTLLFVPSCDKLNNQLHFLKIFKSEVLS